MKYFSTSVNRVAQSTQKAQQNNVRSYIPNFNKSSTGLTSHDALKRLSISQIFETFMKTSLPSIEEKIEYDLVYKYYLSLQSPLLKKDLLLAFKKRQLQIAAKFSEREQFEKLLDLAPTPPFTPANIFFQDLVNVEDEDVGHYYECTNENVQKYFSHGFFGNYIKSEYLHTGKFCFMLTLDAFKIINELRLKDAYFNGKFQIKKLLQDLVETNEVNEFLNHEVRYPVVYNYLAQHFREALLTKRNDDFFDKIFANSFLFDQILNIVMRELKSLELRKCFLDSENVTQFFQILIEHIDNKLDKKYTQLSYMGATLKSLGDFVIKITNHDNITFNHIIHFGSYYKQPRKLPEVMVKYGIRQHLGFNSGLLVHGDKGAGKSCILTVASLWGHLNNWIVLTVPSVYNLTQKDQKYIRHQESKLYLQEDAAVNLLKGWKSANLEHFKEIPVNMSLYGKITTAGVHINDPHPVPREFDEERKVWNDEFDKNMSDELKEAFREAMQDYRIRLGELLHSPTNLLDIIEYGINNPNHSINAIGELLEQLSNLNSHSILIAIDDYNWFYRPSCFLSFRYANSPKLRHKIPPHHLALCRMLMKLDGHKMKRGYKLVGTSLKHLYKHHFDIDKINFPFGFDLKVGTLEMNDMRNMANYYSQSTIFKGSPDDEHMIQNAWLQSQGNFGEAYQILNYGYTSF